MRAPPQGFSQLATSFLAGLRLGIPRMLLPRLAGSTPSAYTLAPSRRFLRKIRHQCTPNSRTSPSPPNALFPLLYPFCQTNGRPPVRAINRESRHLVVRVDDVERSFGPGACEGVWWAYSVAPERR